MIYTSIGCLGLYFPWFCPYIEYVWNVKIRKLHVNTFSICFSFKSIYPIKDDRIMTRINYIKALIKLIIDIQTCEEAVTSKVY